MGGPPKPGPASPANMSKRGLFARLYATYQTLIMVNVRLPKGNPVRGNAGNPRPWERPNPPSGARQTASHPARQRPDRWRAMTRETSLRILAARSSPELCQIICPSITEGAGKAGCAASTRSLMREINKAHERSRYRFAEQIRPSLRNGFNGLFRALPGDEFVRVTVVSGLTICLSPVGPTHLRQLSISNGCQDHTALPSASAPFV
jgi:hypothetical protein